VQAKPRQDENYEGEGNQAHFLRAYSRGQLISAAARLALIVTTMTASAKTHPTDTCSGKLSFENGPYRGYRANSFIRRITGTLLAP